MSDKIQFPTNVPVPLSLQFLEGKPVPSQFGGNQHLFSTTDGRIFFVSETVGNILAEQLRKLHVQKGEPIEIIKAEVPNGNGRKSIQWIVNKMGFAPGEQPDGSFAVDKAPASDLERQLRQSIANGKPGAGAATPAPAAPGNQAPNGTDNGHGSKAKTNGPAHGIAGGHAPEHNLHQGWAQFLLSQTNALIDVYAAASQYASQQHGNAIKPEDVQDLLVTAFIQICKQGGGPGVG